MILSESYINRLKELAGVENLYEDDPIGGREFKNKNIIVNKLGLPSSVLNWAQTLSNGKESYPFAIWAASTLKQAWLNGLVAKSKDANVIKAEISSQLKGDATPEQIKKKLEDSMRYWDGAYRNVIDYFLRRNRIARETDQLNLRDLTLQQAIERSEKWHDKVAEIQGGQIQDEQGDVVLTYPDGFYWIRLNATSCNDEAKAMGHCGNAQGQGSLYSLRQEKYPFVTAEYNPNTGIIYQMKGRGNTKPKESLHPYIYDFLTNPKIGVKGYNSSYKRHTDFNIEDLSQTDFDNLMKAKPILIRSYPEALSKIPAHELESMFIKSSPEEDTFNVYGKIRFVKLTENILKYVLKNHPHFFFTTRLLEYVRLFKDENFIKEINNEINKVIDDDVELFQDVDIDVIAELSKEERLKILDKINFPDKGKVQILGKDFTEYYKEHSDKFDSLLLAIKYGKGYEEIKTDKIPNMTGEFKSDGVELWFNDWTDDNMLALFKDERAAKSIFDFDLGIDHNFNFKDLSRSFDDLNEKHIAIIKHIINKSIKDQNFNIENLRIEKDVFNFLNDEDYNAFSDVDESTIDELKTSFVVASESAQRSADEGEYHDLAVKAVEKFLGKFEWIVKHTKSTDPSKEFDEHNLLQFTIPYKTFIDYVESGEEYHGESDTYYYPARNGVVNVMNMIQAYFEESEKGKLEINDSHGIYGTIDKDTLNDEFDNQIYQRLPEIMNKIKLVKKIKPKNPSKKSK